MESSGQALEYARRVAAESADVKQRLVAEVGDDLWRAYTIIHETFAEKRELFVCGNGGSAADAQHFATELVVRLDAGSRRRPLPATSLATDTSTLTAAGNDFGFEHIFARQIEARAVAGDALVLISTSGNSKNLIEAAREARSLDVATIGLLGKGGGHLTECVDCSVIVPSDHTLRIQECHGFVLHLWCEWLEGAFSS